MMEKYKKPEYLEFKMRKLFSLVILTLFLISPMFAQVETLGTFKQNDCIELLQTCSNCSYNNISSIIYPNSSRIVMNVPMTKDGIEFNYSCGFSSALGGYIVNGHGDIDGQDTNWAYSYEITTNGSTQTTSQGLGSIAFVIIVLAMTITFGYLGYKFMDSDLLWALGIFFIGLCFLLLIYDVWLLYEFKINYTGSSPDAKIPETIFYIFMTVLTTGFMVGIVLLTTKWKVVKDKFKAAIKPEPEDKDDLI